MICATDPALEVSIFRFLHIEYDSGQTVFCFVIGLING